MMQVQSEIAGRVAYHAGLCAEDSIAADYVRRQSGEIDLIARGAEGLVFIEVKASRSHNRAAQRISRRQIERLYSAASEYIAGEPDGQNTDMRFDVALMDRYGAIDIIENAFI
jgi:putative endonuclease